MVSCLEAMVFEREAWSIGAGEVVSGGGRGLFKLSFG